MQNLEDSEIPHVVKISFKIINSVTNYPVCPVFNACVRKKMNSYIFSYISSRDVSVLYDFLEEIFLSFSLIQQHSVGLTTPELCEHTTFLISTTQHYETQQCKLVAAAVKLYFRIIFKYKHRCISCVGAIHFQVESWELRIKSGPDQISCNYIGSSGSQTARLKTSLTAVGRGLNRTAICICPSSPT